MKPYAQVLVDIASKDIDHSFDYLIPDWLQGRVACGQRVEVPFGNRKAIGYVLSLSDESEVAELKEIAGVVDEEPLLNAELLALASWIATEYLSPLSVVYRTMLPAPVRKGREKKKVLALSSAGVEVRVTEKQRMVLEFLNGRTAESMAALARDCGVSQGVVRSLIDKGLVSFVEVGEDIDDIDVFEGPTLTSEQVNVIQSMKNHGDRVYLLHGVTGSGKTEIYLQSIEEVRKQGKTAIVLVPEIALTPQITKRFRERFGSRVALLHSGLNDEQRYNEWMRIYQGKVDVVVGARSAVFAPLSNLGLIVLDEEHENTYRQEESPRYHAREVAIKRASLAGAKCILGSATPSLESYYRAEKREFVLLELPERIGQGMAKVSVVDMKAESKRGNRSMLSQTLREGIARRLERKEQVMLFLNRRGHSTFVLCRGCGKARRCPNCDVSLTYHQQKERLLCHYCDYSEKVPVQCPGCESTQIGFFGIGTQKVEEIVKKAYPQARVRRMDVDTTRRKGAHEEIYTAFAKGEIDILIGTQMIAKGWDIGRVTLVGVISADTSLHLPDFRAGERTFSLLTQVAGRAGRADLEGEVVVQTFSPDNYAIRAALKQDYREFYEEEILARKELGYPPYGSLARIVVSDPDQKVVIAELNGLAEILRKEIDILGPQPAPLPRLRGRSRWQITIKEIGEENKTKAVLKRLMPNGWLEGKRLKPTTRVVVDTDPYNML